jgi:large subunit ribosomal protein L29
MKASELRELTGQELAEKLVEEKANLTKLRLTHAISPVENPMNLRHSRKDVARIATEVRRRQLEGDTK